VISQSGRPIYRRSGGRFLKTETGRWGLGTHRFQVLGPSRTHPQTSGTEPISMLRINRILVPLDFSEHCETALLHAHELAKMHGAHLDVLYVAEVIATPRFDERGDVVIRSEDPAILEPARNALARRLNALDVDADIHVERGVAVEEIKMFTKEHEIDLIVMSSHGYSGFKVRLLGSVSRAVLEDVSCPVLLLKSHGRSLLDQPFHES